MDLNVQFNCKPFIHRLVDDLTPLLGPILQAIPTWRRIPLKKRIAFAACIALVGPAFATLKLPDQFNVSAVTTGGRPGPVVATFEDMLTEVGYVVDDTFDGEITFTWTMKWDSVEGITNSWALFHFYNDINTELTGVGNHYHSTEISTFREPKHLNFGRTSGMTVHAEVDYTFTLIIDYHAGAADTAVLTGGGFVDQPLTPGDWSFHHICVRAGGGPPKVDFTNMSITSRGVGDIEIIPLAYEPVDPRFPSEWQPIRGIEKWAPWPRARIRQLEAERGQLLEKISRLPQHSPIVLSDHLGYHSLFEKPGVDGSPPLHSVDFILKYSHPLNSIAMVPAFSPKGPEAYAFPKRFKIEVLNADTKRFECVVDWMDKDFPDPGPYPVFFSEIKRVVKQVRITVQPSVQASGAAYYALGEVYLFRQKEYGQIADNMAVWGRVGIDVTVSDAFSMPPLWDTSYLHDDYTSLGFPLGGKPEGSEDLMITFDDTSLSSDPVQFTMDLGRVKAIGRIDLWPASAPYLLALPSFGFPSKVSVEMSQNSDFKPAKIIEAEHTGRRVYRENLFTLIGEGYDARYIRITLKELSIYKGKRVLGLGEISASEFGEVLSTNCIVTARGIPAAYQDQLPRLVDGYSRQRRILSEAEWIKGLAQRRPLDRRLTVVERELAQAQAAWKRTKQRFGIWAGWIIFMSLAGGLVVQQRMRKRGINRLKWRIARDLHDEVGSNLGSISLATEELRHYITNTEAEEELSNITLLAREACASLREVVWVIDESTVRLPQLIQKLVERTERVLDGMELFFEVSPDCPDLVLSFPFKRHLTMFFKEAVHNCARHSQATQVWVDFSIMDESLRISFRDNGCGFDLSEPSGGWGLDSMKERAEEMGGEMKLVSQAGKGTSIELAIPQATLSSEPRNAYTTSN